MRYEQARVWTADGALGPSRRCAVAVFREERDRTIRLRAGWSLALAVSGGTRLRAHCTGKGSSVKERPMRCCAQRRDTGSLPVGHRRRGGGVTVDGGGAWEEVFRS